MVGVALLAWLMINKGLGRSDIGFAVGPGMISHLILDLITHSNDIVIAPFIKGPKFGLGLYAKYPIVAFILEIGYGMFCWWVYKGGWALRHNNLIQMSCFPPAAWKVISSASGGSRDGSCRTVLESLSNVMIHNVSNLFFRRIGSSLFG